MSSAINSKNKRKKNKNKNKKQTTAVTQETAEPVVTTAANMAAANAVQVASGGDTILGGADNVTTTLGQDMASPSPLSDHVQHGIHSTVASQSIDIHSIIDTISSHVQSGKYKEKEMPVQNKLLAGTAIQQQEEAFPIQNKSFAETEAMEASSHTDTKPVDTIQQEEALPIQNKSFAETEALSSTNTKPADTIQQQQEEALPVQNKSFAETEAIEAYHEASAPTAPNEISHKNARSDSHKPEPPSKDTTMGTAIASAGAATVAAVKSKSSKKQEALLSKPLPTPNKSSTPPPPVSKDTVVPAISHYVMSDNVKHCVDSAIKAPSVNVDRIIHLSKDIQRPEPAIGSSNQPAMPSSTKTPDVPNKAKSPEQRRSNKPSFLKKKSCIIL